MLNPDKNGENWNSQDWKFMCFKLFDAAFQPNMLLFNDVEWIFSS